MALKLLRIPNLRLDLDDPPERLLGLAAERLGLPSDSIQRLEIARRALDARQKRHLQWNYQVDVAVADPEAVAQKSGLALVEPEDPFLGLEYGRETLPGPPIVVGCGPAGLFAAYVLALHGYAPVLLERGADVRTRVRDVRLFWKGGQLDPESNLLFGEGGAGTFSDGKLTCRSASPFIPYVLRTMVEHRAPASILYDARPHIGTDRLRAVLVTLRRHMADLGVEFRFGSRVDDLLLQDGRVRALRVGGQAVGCGPVLLGIGHSARDTYEMLRGRGVALQFKPFQFGVRVEHPQELIDRSQYGDAAGHPRLGPAEYVLTRETGHRRRSVFSFCMCPGGVVLPSVSEPAALCTNGMSNHKRNSGLANGGIVVTIGEAEVPGSGPLKGIRFQRHYEHIAFRMGGGHYAAPAQAIPDFVRGILRGRKFQTTYPLGYVEADLREALPQAAGRAIASALKEFDQRLPGFAGEAGTVTGPEARGSSPVRILRDPQTLESVSVSNLYPIGEGAGYAGGIVSAAIDGVRTALAVLRRYAPPLRASNAGRPQGDGPFAPSSAES